MLAAIPPLLLQFLITVCFSFIIGLEYHNYLKTNHYQYRFGSIRTFVLIGLLGLVLYQMQPDGSFFLAGMGFLGIMLGIFYWRQSAERVFTILEIILTLMVFMIGPVAVIFPGWYLVLFVVLLILLLGEKPVIHQFSHAVDNNEIITLAKFLIISGVILPLLPDREISAQLPVTYYKVWLAVIIVSGFSYLSYLAQTYLFKARGLLLTGFLGGLYSSTAVTVVISRRAHKMNNDWANISAALIMATAMMYLRLLLIIFLFNKTAAVALLAPFSVFILLSLIAVVVILHFSQDEMYKNAPLSSDHPLELPTALFFACMFVIFTFITEYITHHFGHQGLQFLSIIIGFTDIDPFILSLLSGKYAVSIEMIVSSIIVASGSNNILKAVYAIFLARNKAVLPAVLWLVMLALLSFLYVFYR